LELLVSSILTEEFLLWQGRFVQTCAYVELCAFNVVSAYYEDFPELNKRYLSENTDWIKVRKGNFELKKNFKMCANHIGGETGKSMFLLLKRVESAEMLRHMLVHGNWKRSKDGSGFQVQYYYDASNKKEPSNWQEYGWSEKQKIFTLSEIISYTHSAQEVYNELGEIFRKIVRQEI